MMDRSPGKGPQLLPQVSEKGKWMTRKDHNLSLGIRWVICRVGPGLGLCSVRAPY